MRKQIEYVGDLSRNITLELLDCASNSDAITQAQYELIMKALQNL